MNKTVILIIFAILILAAITLAVLAASCHRILVIEGISGIPISGAYITIERSSGSPEDVGSTDENGELVFWTSPLPIPQIICAQKTFYPPGCVNAIGLTPSLTS
jgi:hypothetical protein